MIKRITSYFNGFLPKKVEVKVEKKDTRIKIAIDESIGSSLCRKLEEKGYKVVVRAGHAETDDSWMKRALAKGALFIVSPDLDIPSMIEKEGYPMVWIDYLFAGTMGDWEKDDKRRVWADYIDARIKSKTRFLRQEFGGQDGVTTTK